MTNIDFEALGLRYSDRIWITGADGAGSWGMFLDEYDSVAQTFLFIVNRDHGLTARIHLPSVRTIER